MNASLGALAAWNGPLAGVGVTALVEVAEALPTWRGRVELVARELDRPSTWSGPAAAAGGGALVELATVAMAVAASLLESLAALRALADASVQAERLAGESLALAAAPAGDDPSLPARAAELADEATACAVRAAAAVELAEAPLVRLGGGLGGAGVLGAATFRDLVLALGLDRPVAPPPVPAGQPEDVARWWSSLSPAAQHAAADGEPDRIGNLDGVPAWARDRANRVLLARLTHDVHGPGGAVAQVVSRQLAAAEAAGRPAQLYEFDAAAGLVAVVDGDLDAAGEVAVLVPGIRTTPQDLPGLIEDAERVSAAAQAAAPATTVASVAWLGYRTPRSLPEIMTTRDAKRGGAALDTTLRGLAASRASSGGGRPRTTVVAHSYGTVVVGQAAARPGRLAADAVVLLGSPGMPSGGAARLESGEVYDAWSPADPISCLGWFGADPQVPQYGAVPLPTDWHTPHSGYYDPAHPTLAGIGRAVAGSGR